MDADTGSIFKAGIKCRAQGGQFWMPIGGQYSKPIDNEAEIIDPADEQTLKTQLAMYERDTTNQIVVVTVKSLRGMAIEEFSLELGNYWDVGQREKNNGVLLVVAPVDKQVRIEVGLGLEDILTDAEAKHIIDDFMIPHFNSELYSLGIVSGVNAIIEAIGM